jgi:hypothetical protein
MMKSFTKLMPISRPQKLLGRVSIAADKFGPSPNFGFGLLATVK